MYCTRSLLLFALAFSTALLTSARGSEPDQAGIKFFEKKIQPMLVKHCYECHSAKADEIQGGLRLDTRDGIRSGGDNGPAVVPGEPDESFLLRAIRFDEEDYEMPPEGKLPDSVIANFEKWINMGAPDPRGGQEKKTVRRESIGKKVLRLVK